MIKIYEGVLSDIDGDDLAKATIWLLAESEYFPVAAVVRKRAIAERNSRLAIEQEDLERREAIELETNYGKKLDSFGKGDLLLEVQEQLNVFDLKELARTTKRLDGDLRIVVLRAIARKSCGIQFLKSVAGWEMS